MPDQLSPFRYWISNGYGLTLASFSGFFLSNIFGCIVMGYVVSIKQHITPSEQGHIVVPL